MNNELGLKKKKNWTKEPKFVFSSDLSIIGFKNESSFSVLCVSVQRTCTPTKQGEFREK